jgi:hypothetical protein
MENENEYEYESDSEKEMGDGYEMDDAYQIQNEKEPIKIPEIDYSKMFKEVTVLNNIKTYITYINTDNEIEIIHQKKIYLDNDDNIVTRRQLIDVIKNSQKKNKVKYKLISIMVYNIHVTPESLPEYIENPNDFISLYTLNRIDSFELKPTLRLLKKYNGIYFFFFECPEHAAEPEHTTLLSKQELINNGFIKNKNNTTKRIHIRSSQKQKRQSNNKTKRCDRYVNLL